MNEQMEILVEIALDAPTGTKRYALRDVITPTKYYEGRIVSFGDIDREIAIVPGEFRMTGFGIELDNSDNHFSNLKNITPFKNRVVTLLYGDLAVGEADFTAIATCKIEQFGGGDIFRIETSDESLLKFDQPLTTVITKNLFPNLPDGTPLELIPLVVGTVSSVGLSNTGALPAYLIDPAVAQAKFQYVAAQNTIKAIDTVYKYGVVVASGFTVQQRTFGAITITTIEFDADQRDVNRPNELEVTWDGQGLTDDGTPTGANITNPALQWKEVLLNQGFASGDLDTASFNDARDIYNVRNVKGGFAEIDKAETLRIIAERMAESLNMTTVNSLVGKIAVTVPEPGATAASAPLIDESQIVRGSFGWEGSDELYSALEHEFSRNWQAGEFDESAEINDAAETIKIGEKITEKAEFWYLIDPSGASAVANDKMFFAREKRVVVNFLADPVLFKTALIGSDIRVTHFAGLGASGFSKQLFRVIGTGLTFDDQNILTRLRLVDLTEASFLFTKDYLKYKNKELELFTDHKVSENERESPLVIS